MPLAPPTLATGFLTPALLAAGHKGPGLSKFSLGVATGVVEYLTTQAKVITVDVGSLGVGTGFSFLVIPPQILINSFLRSFAAAQLLGSMASKTATGLGNGLAVGLAALAWVRTDHPVVGLGAAVGKITGPSSVTAIGKGLSSVGMSGAAITRSTKAIGLGLDIVLQSLPIPIPIVGGASPMGGSGVGTGKII